MITFSKTFKEQYDEHTSYYTLDDVDLMACIYENRPWLHYDYANDWMVLLMDILLSNHIKGNVPMRVILDMTEVDTKGRKFLEILAENDFNVCIR